MSAFNASSIRHTLAAVLLLPAAARASLPLIAGPTTDGSTPFGPAFGTAIGINNSGVAVGVSGVSNYAQRVVRYSATGSQDLPALSVAPGNTSNGGFSNAVGVSDDGVVVGTSRRYNGTTYVDAPGVYWDAAGAVHLLATPAPPVGGKSSVTPKAISGSGVIAAESSIYNASNQLISLQVQRFNNAAAAPTALDTPTSIALPKQYALGVNRGGTVVGYVNPNGSLVATRWRGDGTSVEALATPETTAPSVKPSNVANAVSDGDVTVGYSTHYVGTTYRGSIAARWDAAGNAISLGSLETATDGTQISSATLINAAGNIAGTSVKYGGTNTSTGTFGVRWLPGATSPTELGTLGGSTGRTATLNAMNAAGTIVGSSTTPTSVHAALWTRDNNAAIDLNTLIAPDSNWTLTRADRISDTGWVAGLGNFDPDGSGSQVAYGRLFSVLIPQAGTYGQGDANFDTKVDFNDLVILAQHYGQTNSAQATNVGDFDLNGVTDFNDLVVLAQHYGSAANVTGLGDRSFQADWALAQSLVPEPGSLAVVAMGLLLTRRRRAAV